ncbi:MAG TPA: PQQ-binding-like beta-propeller repeat protein [Planctomycetaceae bacterium]
MMAGSATGIIVWRHCHQTAPHSDDATLAKPSTDPNAGRANPCLPSGTPDRGWPFIRGPNFDGQSPEVNLADTWPAAGPPVLWHRPLGEGYSAFTAGGDRVFTQYQALGGQYLACLRADTGETIWEYRYDWPYEAGGMYPGPRATPTLNNGRIYFAAPSGLVGCLTWDGQLVWEVQTRERFAWKREDFGYSCSPTVVDGLVLLPVGGPGAAMVALDARDGSTKWQAGNDSASYVPAFPIAVNGHKQVIGYLENALASFDQNDGHLVWRKELSQGYDEHAAWPIYVEPQLWISAPFKWGSSLLTLTEEGVADNDVWHSNLLSNDVFSSVCHNGLLFGFDLKDVQAKAHRASRGKFRCLDLATGTPKWETDQTGHASVLVADEKLILFNDQGELILARAIPEKYDELARVSVLAGGICWTPPALDRGRLFVRNRQQAACLFIGRPELLQMIPTSDGTGPKLLTAAEIPQTGADMQQGGHYDLAALLGAEPEYMFDVPDKAWLQNWYWTGVCLLALAALLAGLVSTTWSSGETGLRRLFWCFAFVLGAVAMTPLSLHRGEFVFTWPVSLFVAFQATMQQVQIGRHEPVSRAAAWRSRGVALLFLLICYGYYLLCRRLSLAFEWVFLSGFVAAIPIALASRWLARRSARPILVGIVSTALEFSAYFWTSVAWLWWKYPGGA